jgi:branched-chain amino acid transport system ATP-binding protein
MSLDSGTPVLEVSGLRRAFGGLVAVNDLGFAVGQGEIMGLLGPNGSGKTTALNLMSGVLRSDAGTIRLMGRDCAAWAGADVSARPRARRHGLPREHQGGAGVSEAASAGP